MLRPQWFENHHLLVCEYIDDQTIDDICHRAWCLKAHNLEDAYNHITKALHIVETLTHKE